MEIAMTRVTAILGLIPLALGAGQTGKEILHPLAVVVIGATILDQIVTPAAFKLFGKYVYRKPGPKAGGPTDATWDDAWRHEPAREPGVASESKQPGGNP